MECGTAEVMSREERCHTEGIRGGGLETAGIWRREGVYV